MLFWRGLVVLLIVFVIAFSLQAQDESEKKEESKYGWEKKFIGTLNATQTTLSNWTTGGENAWAWQLNLNGGFVNNQEKYNWANTIRILYGKAKIGSDDPKKTDDEIFLETVFTYKVWSTFNPYASATGLTQFSVGYDYGVTPKVKISDFLDPGYFRESIGLEYKPNDKFKTRFGASMKQTVADVFAIRWSDDPETENDIEKIRNELGAESVTDFKTNLSELLVYVTKLELFSNLNRFDEIDVRWDNLISAKVAEYISVSFNFVLYYDKDISLKRQLKQTLAVGLTYSFL